MGCPAKLERKPGAALLDQGPQRGQVTLYSQLLATPGETALGLQRPGAVVERKVQVERGNVVTQPRPLVEIAHRALDDANAGGRQHLERRRKVASSGGGPRGLSQRGRNLDDLRPFVAGRGWLCGLHRPRRGKGQVPTAAALRVDPQLDHGPRQDEPLDACLLREQRLEAQLGLQRPHCQSRRAAHAGRGRERDVCQRDREPWKENEGRGPRHREVAAGARFDLLNQPVAHQLDGGGNDQERDRPEQQAAHAQRRVSRISKPRAALPAATLVVSGPWRVASRASASNGPSWWRSWAEEGGPAWLGCRNQHKALVQIMSQAGSDGTKGRHFFHAFAAFCWRRDPRAARA